MSVQLLVVPYDSGYENVRMGCGPGRFLEFGLEERIRSARHLSQVEFVRNEAEFRTEVTSAYELNRCLAPAVRGAVEDDRVPVVLSGNCNSALGILGGLPFEDVGVIWFDAHGDFHTPETTRSGFFDGMALAAVAGRCWRTLSATIPGFVPIPEEYIVLVGARAMEPEESAAVRDSALNHVSVPRIREGGVEATLIPILSDLATCVRRVYVHMDLDVLDPTEARANGYAEPDGLTRAEVSGVLELVRQRFDVCAAAVAAYDPSVDTDDAAVAAGMQFVCALLDPSTSVFNDKGL
jgi:arginase